MRYKVKKEGSTTGRTFFQSISIKPRNMAAMTSLVKGFVDFRLSFLKEGYFTSLTIIIERKNMRMGSRYRRLPRGKSRSSSHSKNNVTEATIPAAAGMG